MIKPLLKKQWLETASFFFLNRKDGKKRQKLATLGVVILILYALGASGVLFWKLSETLCAPLVAGGLTWVYFAFVGIIASGISAIGSVFMAKSKLFEAKDNDFLLSLPLPTWAILLARMISLYAIAFACSALAFIPALVQYFVVAGFSFLPFLFGVLSLFIMPFGTLAICSLLGWLIAFITARMPAKNLITVLFFVGFMALYFVVIDKVNEYLVYVIANGEAVGAQIRATLYPFWKLGLAVSGDPIAMLLTVAMNVGAFALVYLLLTKTFLSVTIVKRGEKRKVYRVKDRKEGSASVALLKKELAHVLKNPLIFLNAGMGTVLSLVLFAVALFNIDFCKTLTATLGVKEISSLLTALLCFIASSNVFTGSSVSLEGENLWVVRSLPVTTGTVFKAKLSAHFIFTLLPVTATSVLLYALLEIPVTAAVFGFLTVCAVSVFCALAGLAMNLKMPNLHWTNEVAAVKQSYSVLLTMFLGWGASALIVGGWFWFGKNMLPWGYFSLCTVLFSALNAVLVWWLKAHGEKTFERL